MDKLKKEILDAIELFSKNENYEDIKEYITTENSFLSLYGCNLYWYVRVSTTKQEFDRQIIELYKYLKEKNLKICIDNIYCDKFTGKRLDRKEYQNLRSVMIKNDYFIIAEVARLGRNWDEIKKEWYKLKAEEINLLVMDFDLLSAPLPHETSEKMTIDKKFMQESVFNGVLYASCKKLEEVSRTTKDGLEKAQLKGVKLGRPKDARTTLENFKKILRFMIDKKMTQNDACSRVRYPVSSFKIQLKQYYQKYNTKDYKEILDHLEREKETC